MPSRQCNKFKVTGSASRVLMFQCFGYTSEVPAYKKLVSVLADCRDVKDTWNVFIVWYGSLCFKARFYP